jgi:hypothetical protein
MTMAKRLICALVSAICRFGKSIGKRGLYGKVGKAQRVAVLRALRKMTLPGTWHVRRTGYGRGSACSQPHDPIGRDFGGWPPPEAGPFPIGLPGAVSASAL